VGEGYANVRGRLIISAVVAVLTVAGCRGTNSDDQSGSRPVVVSEAAPTSPFRNLGKRAEAENQAPLPEERRRAE